MAIKQLVIRRKIDQRRKSLDELKLKDDEFAKRSSDLEESINQAETDEEMEAVEAEVETLDSEQKEHDGNKKTLEDEIAALEQELEELNENAPKNNEKGDEGKRSVQTHIESRGTIGMKVNRGFFKGMERSYANDFIQREDVKKFLTDIRDGNVLSERQQKRDVTGAELGIPVTILELLRDNLNRYSKLISKVNLRALKGTARTNIVGEIPEAIWTEACGNLNELDLQFHQIEVDGYKVGGFLAVCNATLEDTDFNLANEILDALGQAIGLAVDKAILYGTGRKMPFGIVPMLAATSQPTRWGDNAPTWVNVSETHIGQVSGETAQESFANLIRFSGKARANYGTGNKFWAMNENTYTELQARLVTFNAAGAIVASVNNTMPIINGDIVILPFMADGDIVGGYGSQYVLVERAGTQFASSEHAQFIEDNTVYKGTARYDGRPIVNNGFVAMNITGAAPQTSIAFAPDVANEEPEAETP